jgi:Arc/MetJ-type ribon-helix-helix transcriptional regulator
MKTTLKVSLPDDLYYFIIDRMEHGAFTSASEYVRDLIRGDRSRVETGKKQDQRKRPAGPRRMNQIMRDEY